MSKNIKKFEKSVFIVMLYTRMNEELSETDSI